jgi:2-methylcitrate dehydratase PrpD
MTHASRTAPMQSEMDRISAYIASALSKPLPAEVSAKTKQHVLDTLSAMVSGFRLKPGLLITEFLRSQGGNPEALLVGSGIVTTAINAALGNGFMAHADETDDSHAPSITHPGCAVVPAALAVAERRDAGGEAMLRAVALGYDVGCRVARVMSRGPGRVHGHSTHAVGGLFGATAAAASLTELTADEVRQALAYAGQQASGITSWARDPEHVEKAFVFGGMGARNAVTAALFVEAGFSAEHDIFSGEDNFLDVFCPSANELGGLVDTLGHDYEIMLTNIKKYPVGSPIQAAAEALASLIDEHRIVVESVRQIDVHLPPEIALLVDNRAMPNINCQYAMAVLLLDRELTFDALHSYDRMSDVSVKAIQKRVNLIPDKSFVNMERRRPATVKVHLNDGDTLQRHVPAVRGTPDNPMSQPEVESKSVNLLSAVLGAAKAHQLVEEIWTLERLRSIRSLRPLLSV